MKPTKKDLQNKLYLPLQVNNGKKEYMFDTHGKIKAYKSTSTLEIYAPEHDLVATYRLSSIKQKENINTN